MKTTRFILFTLLALSLAMFVACNNEPASPSQGSIECYLNGIIYDAETSAPLKGAKVSIGTQSDTTDQNGCFVLKGVAPGSYNMSVVKDGYLSYIQEDILVDSGRFYNKALSDEDKALLADLIKNGEEIDDNFMELLFGERGVERNPDIETIGDSKTYGQTVVAVGLRPINAFIEGKIDIKFAEDGSVYSVPEGTGMIAICVDEPVVDPAQAPEVIATYRTTVGKDGNFKFSPVVPGFYYLIVDSMCVTYNDISINIDAEFFNEDPVAVIAGKGEAGQLFIEAEGSDPFKVDFKVLSVKAVDKSEIPVSDGSRVNYPNVTMKAGQAICIEFSKPIDENADGTMFFFTSEETQITGYTKHVIINGDDRHGYAYVWHDSINNIADLRLHFHVSSVEKDEPIGTSIGIDYAYQLNIVSTNLYGYKYDNELRDGVFKADEPIVIIFDKEIPQNCSIEGILTQYFEQVAEPIDVTFDYDGRILYVYAPLKYGTTNGGNFSYELEFKITTNEDVVIYNTKNGLFLPAFRNLLLADGDCIVFSTDVITFVKPPVFKSLYEPVVMEFNQSLEKDTVSASIYRKPSNVDDPKTEIELICEVDENKLTLSLPEKRALLPGAAYCLSLTIKSDRDAEVFSFSTDFYTYDINSFDGLFSNGLEDFTIVGDDYNWNSTDVKFSWTSLGINLGKEGVYQLWVTKNLKTWEKYIPSFDEISVFDYWYRDKKIEKTATGVFNGTTDLLAFGCGAFVLVTEDKDGLMIQSPVRYIFDEVGPNVITDPLSVEIVPDTPFSTIHEHPVEFILTSDEPIDSIKEADVVIGGAHPEYFKVTWEMSGEKSAAFKVDAVAAPLSGKYAEGDLMLTITLRDTTYNKTELVLDFKDGQQ